MSAAIPLHQQKDQINESCSDRQSHGYLELFIYLFYRFRFLWSRAFKNTSVSIAQYDGIHTIPLHSGDRKFALCLSNVLHYYNFSYVLVECKGSNPESFFY